MMALPVTRWFSRRHLRRSANAAGWGQNSGKVHGPRGIGRSRKAQLEVDGIGVSLGVGRARGTGLNPANRGPRRRQWAERRLNRATAVHESKPACSELRVLWRTSCPAGAAPPWPARISGHSPCQVARHERNWPSIHQPRHCWSAGCHLDTRCIPVLASEHCDDQQRGRRDMDAGKGQ